MRLKPFTIWLLTAATLSAQVVDGRVINAATGAGIPDVSVGLFTLGQTAYTAVTDAAGRFRIESVKDGSYLPFYNAANFWPIARPNPNRPFQVTAGAGPVHLEIAMAPVSKISGRVLDGAGNPVPKATVQFMQATQLGGMVFVLDADDKGEYDSPKSMAPGSWMLSATAPSSWKPPEPRDGQPLGWAHTFYPSVTDPELAVKIELPPAGEISKLDIKLAAVPVHRIRGVVLDANGNPSPKVSVVLGTAGAAGAGGILGPPSLHQTTGADGAFEFESVVKGVFRVSTTVTENGVKQWGAQSVEVAGHDLENVKLQLTLPFSIQGKIVIAPPEGAAPPTLPMVELTSDTTEGPLFGYPNGEGDFTVKNLYPGTYRIDPGSAPPPYYLDSIRFGGINVPQSGVQILSDDQSLILTYKKNGGTVRGAIDDCGAGYVLLVPQNPALRRAGFLAMTRCAKDGRFEFAAVRPGEYYGIAVSPTIPVDVSSSFDQNLMNQSARVSVRANEATDAEIRVVKR